MYWVYVIQNIHGWRYIGSSENIASRLKRHNSNSVRSTKHRGPFAIIYKESFETRTAALKREHQLKKNKDSSLIDKLSSVPIV